METKSEFIKKLNTADAICILAQEMWNVRYNVKTGFIRQQKWVILSYYEDALKISKKLNLEVKK